MKTYLGFDVGRKRIGVAVGQDVTGTASALSTLLAVNGEPDWEHIKQLIKQWQPAAAIIGLPLHADQTESAVTAMARQFAQQLQARFKIPVHLIDERLSSREAQDLISTKSMNRARSAKMASQNKAEIDRIAAQIILQSWLNEQA